MKVTTTFELRPEQALEMLCKTLHMDFAFTDDDSFYIKEDPMTGELAVWYGDKIYDDRAELFIAIRNMMVCIIPNLSFRSDNYILSGNGIEKFNSLAEKFLVKKIDED